MVAPLKRKGRDLILLKTFVLAVTALSFLGILSCHSGTHSAASSSGTSGTGTGWTITIQGGTNPLHVGNTTSILATVRDSTGAPAPIGTNVCMTVVINALIQGDELFATLCETTTNNLGQSIHTYAAVNSGEDTVEVISQNTIQRASITVN